MKEINLTMDKNGHVSCCTYGGGVAGEHHAAQLNLQFEDTAIGADWYRLYFAGDNGTVTTEKLQPNQNLLCYTLPSEVTNLGNTVLCQLCGYAGQQENLQLLYKSDTFPLTFGTTLDDTARVANDGLTDRLNAMLSEVETISQNFDLVLGTVTSVDFPAQASAALQRTGDYRYTLNLTLPKGEKGDGNFAPGKRVTIVNGEISVDSRPQVYDAVENLYGYPGIREDKTVNQLAGTVFVVNPKYPNTSNAVSFFTDSEHVYYPLHRFQGNTLVSDIPVGAIVAGRPMAVYVNDAGIPVYLNPYEAPANPLPLFTVTPEDTDTAFPTLRPNTYRYDEFAHGKTIVASLTDDLVLNGKTWYGPLMCPVTVFDGTSWVDTQHIVNRMVTKGQPLLLCLTYDQTNASFSSIRWLNPPI